VWRLAVIAAKGVPPALRIEPRMFGRADAIANVPDIGQNYHERFDQVKDYFGPAPIVCFPLFRGGWPALPVAGRDLRRV